MPYNLGNEVDYNNVCGYMRRPPQSTENKAFLSYLHAWSLSRCQNFSHGKKELNL